MIAPYLWQALLGGLVGVLTWRIVSAPYYMWKEEHDRANAAEEKVAALEAELANARAWNRNDRRKNSDILDAIGSLRDSGRNWRP